LIHHPLEVYLNPFPGKLYFLTEEENKEHELTLYVTSLQNTCVARPVLISTNFYKMTTDDDEKAGNPVLGDQPAPSSSSSSKSGRSIDAQGDPQHIEQEEVPTNPVAAISSPTMTTVPTTFKCTNSIAHDD
jgi:hypothetical protein